MTIDDAFVWANRLILLFWLLLIIAPRWRWTDRLVHRPWATLAVAAAYLWFASSSFLGGASPDGGGFATLDGVMALFGSKPAVMAGWLHYLAMDLFVGAWQARDARRLGLSHWLLVPCLILTLVLGPVGLALYLAIRAAVKRRLSLAEAEA